jgi:hypothetical protein
MLMDWYPLLMGDPFNLKKVNGLTLITAICIVGDDEGALLDHVRRISGQFSDIRAPLGARAYP